MNKREFVQDTAQKILLAHLATRSVVPEQSGQLVKNIAKMSGELADALEVSGNGWAPRGADPTCNVRNHVLSQPPFCHKCKGVGSTLGKTCRSCHGSGLEVVEVQPR